MESILNNLKGFQKFLERILKMNIDWGAIAIIVLILTVGSCGIVDFNGKNNIKLKQIEYCRELKIQNCPEVN